MDTVVTEIAPRVYRISGFHPDFGIQFNQFLIDDDEPFLMHTGLRRSFARTVAGVESVIDPARLRWIGYSHFEADECGALNQWLELAPNATALHGFVGTIVNLNDFADRPPRQLADGEVVAIGEKRLRYLATPHVPHGWDAGLFFEETESTLFCSDLFFQPADPEPLIEAEIVARAREAIVGGMAGPLANDLPFTPYTLSTFERLAQLNPRTLATMHGSSFRGDGGAALGQFGAVVEELYGSASTAAR